MVHFVPWETHHWGMERRVNTPIMSYVDTGRDEVMVLDMESKECDTNVPQTPRRTSTSEYTERKSHSKIIIFKL